ncbi:hypothetical protein KUTeg_006299 [Tegillarca granosa]|uniref:Uncharacterized protein n=1 Tax=Tegillarca granosa TaxID=220873 RepID=A0ABQ9FJ31_TEGGR|nr:hypothetical protein KUTeg_006299 [Tegillarca granosa]
MENVGVERHWIYPSGNLGDERQMENVDGVMHWIFLSGNVGVERHWIYPSGNLGVERHWIYPSGNLGGERHWIYPSENLGVERHWIYWMENALRKDAYDHYTAIYYLLLERLKLHRSSFPPENRIDARKRRPSSIAEQAMLRMNPSQSSANQTPQHNEMQRTPLANVKGMFSHTTDCVTPPIQSYTTNQCPLYDTEIPIPAVTGCMQDMLPRVTATQSALTSHMITTSIDEGVEADMMDSDTNSESSYKGQFVKDGFGMGLIPSCAFGDFSQLSKNSNNSSTSINSGSPFTSFDSTLEPDFMSSLSLCSQQTFGSDISGASLGGDNSISRVTSGAIDVYSQEDSKLVEDNQSEEINQDRQQTRSPVNFREGRRASDGLVAQGIIAFKQRLKESMRAQGMVELRQEHQNLPGLFQRSFTEDEAIQLQLQNSDLQDGGLRQSSLDEQQSLKARPRPLMKRMSLPSETFDIQPHQLLALKQSLQVEREMDRAVSHEEVQQVVTQAQFVSQQTSFDFASGNKPLQQALLQHRLQQKRQTLQKQSQLHNQFQQLQIDSQNVQNFYPVSNLQSFQLQNSSSQMNYLTANLAHQQRLSGQHDELGRPPVIRKTSYKLAQQQPVMPPFQDLENPSGDKFMPPQIGNMIPQNINVQYDEVSNGIHFVPISNPNYATPSTQTYQGQIYLNQSPPFIKRFRYNTFQKRLGMGHADLGMGHADLGMGPVYLFGTIKKSQNFEFFTQTLTPVEGSGKYDDDDEDEDDDEDCKQKFEKTINELSFTTSTNVLLVKQNPKRLPLMSIINIIEYMEQTRRA